MQFVKNYRVILFDISPEGLPGAVSTTTHRPRQALCSGARNPLLGHFSRTGGLVVESGMSAIGPRSAKADIAFMAKIGPSADCPLESRDGPLYDGRLTGVLQTPEGALIEIMDGR